MLKNLRNWRLVSIIDWNEEDIFFLWTDSVNFNAVGRILSGQILEYIFYLLFLLLFQIKNFTTLFGSYDKITR
jgi:hypothetical protein